SAVAHEPAQSALGLSLRSSIANVAHEGRRQPPIAYQHRHRAARRELVLMGWVFRGDKEPARDVELAAGSQRSVVFALRSEQHEVQIPAESVEEGAAVDRKERVVPGQARGCMPVIPTDEMEVIRLHLKTYEGSLEPQDGGSGREVAASDSITRCGGLEGAAHGGRIQAPLEVPTLGEDLDQLGPQRLPGPVEDRSVGVTEVE